MFEQKLQTPGLRNPEENASILLTSIDKEAALMYDAASDIVTARIDMKKPLKK